MNSNKNDSNNMGWADILAGKTPEQYQKEQFEGKSRKELIEQYNKNIYAIQDYKEDVRRKTEKLKRTFDAAHYATTTAILSGGGLTGLVSILCEAAGLINPNDLLNPKKTVINELIKNGGELYIPSLIDSKIFGITQMKESIQSIRKENKILKEMIEADGYKMKFKKNLRIPRKNQFI